MDKRKNTIQLMVFMAMYAALAVVLDIIKEFIPFTSLWANGGSIDISLIPLVFASIHLGYIYGIITGLLEFGVSIAFGTTKLYFAPYNVALGFLCDYIIPVAIMGAASIFMNKNYSRKKNMIMLELGILLCMLIRIISQVVSGVYCWVDASDIGSIAAWIFSLRYNLGYGVPTMIMLLIVMPILYRTFERVIKRQIV